jgi:hypothetical protein
MSEVKVRITAQNQTQTGFQSVLSDAKRTATQVRQTFSQAATPAAGGGGGAGGSVLFGPNMTTDDWVAQAERNIEENLKKRKALRESMKETAGGAQDGSTIGPKGGGFLSFVGAATAAVGVGMFLNRTIQAVGERFQEVTKASDQFSQSLGKIGQASSISELVSGLNSANSEFDALQKKSEDFKQLKFTFESIANNLANVFSGGALFQSVDDNVANARREKGLQTQLSLARQLQDIQEQTATIQSGGDVQEVKARQQVERLREELRKSLEGQSPQTIQRALGRFDAITGASEELRQAERDAENQRAQDEKQKRSNQIAREIRIKKAQASGDTATAQREMLLQSFDSAMERSGATIGQAKDLAAIEAAMRAQQELNSSSFKGSQGASAFQRIGFASNEFFDTRNKPENNFSKLFDQMRKAADAAVRIDKKVKEGDLVLQSTNS